MVVAPEGAGAAWDDGWVGGEGGGVSFPHALNNVVITATDRNVDFMCFPFY
jgi:hypothetical protein